MVLIPLIKVDVTGKNIGRVNMAPLGLKKMFLDKFITTYLRNILLFCFVIILCISIVFAYWPSNWDKSHARNDWNKSEIVVIGRVVDYERIMVKKKEFNAKLEKHVSYYFFTYIAKIAVGDVLKGKIDENVLINIPVGNYVQFGKIDETKPVDFKIANNPGYDLKINGVYLLYLNSRKNETGKKSYKPRSGYFSINKIEKDKDGNHVICRGDLFNKYKPSMKLSEYIKDLRRRETIQKAPE